MRTHGFSRRLEFGDKNEPIALSIWTNLIKGRYPPSYHKHTHASGKMLFVCDTISSGADLILVSPRYVTDSQEEDIRLMKVMFDFYDQNRDGKLSPSQACLLCT